MAVTTTATRAQTVVGWFVLWMAFHLAVFCSGLALGWIWRVFWGAFRWSAGML